jgi:predicted transcriptional regulator
MPYEKIKARTLAIARGELKPSPRDPKVWVVSTEALGKILSGENKELLQAIRNTKPKSIQELADTTGRAKSNLHRTLKKMERFGFVALERRGREVTPRVLYDKMTVEIDLAA